MCFQSMYGGEMRPNYYYRFMAWGLLLMVAACEDESSAISADGEADASADGSIGWDVSRDDAVADTSDLANEDPVTEVFSDVSSEVTEQDPIDFLIRNQTGESVFLDATWSSISILSACFVEPGGTCEPVQFELPWCVASCESVEPDSVECCIDCGAPPSQAIEIGPGDEWVVTWGGSIFAYDGVHCECGCYRAALPPIGVYQAQSCVFGDYTCNANEPCRPEEAGVVFPAEVTDLLDCVDVTFEVPTDQEQLVLTLE